MARQDDEGQFAREHQLRLPPWGSCFVVITADGRLLRGQTQNLERALTDGLAAWNRLPAAERAPAAVVVGEPGPADPDRLTPDPPPGGLILRHYYRLLTRAADGGAKDRLHHLPAALQRRIVVVASRRGEVADHVRCWIEERALLRHQRQRLVRQPGAMLDAPDAGPHRGQRALGAVRMRLHGHFLAPCLLDNRAKLLFAEHLLARIGVGRPGTFGRVDLDPVHPMRQVGAYDAPKAFDGGHAAQEVAQIRIGEEQLRRRVRADVIPRGPQVGAGHVSLLDQFAQPDVDERRTDADVREAEP